MKLRIILGLTVLTILSFVLVSSTSYSKSCACDYQSTPSPEVTVTPSPTEEPTASPSAIPVETEIPYPCVDDKPTEACCNMFGCDTPQPSDSPEPPVVTPEPQQPSSGEAPSQPSCQAMVAPTILTWSRPTGNQVKLTWSETGNVDSYVVYYGTEEHNLPWNVKVEHSHEVILNQVPDESIWTRIVATDGTCEGPSSITIDP